MSPNLSSPQILIVEDEWIIALDIKGHLDRLGYGVAGIANCAEKAIKLVEETQPDLVLMDIYLQGETTGIEVAEILRRDFQLPIVFLTSHTDDATLQEAIATNPNGYIVKPFEALDLSISLQVALTNHKAERILQEAIAKEKHLNELKSQFISIVSHEFRNPLHFLLLALGMLEQEKIPLERKLHYIERGKVVISELSQLIDDVLIVGEVERDQFYCQPTSVNIVDFCSSLVEDMRSRFQLDQNHLIFNIYRYHEQDLCLYDLDSKLLEHILINLLENAVKYSPKNIKITFDLKCQPNLLEFRVRDEGIGLSKEDQLNIFTPFHRGQNVGDIRGTGLGLAIVKKCVDAHNGIIQVTSNIGEGTEFTVTLQT